MRLALAFLVRNWPLKLAALFLATVLYAGLVLAQNTRTFPARVPIEPVRPPAGASLLESLPDVTTIRYRAPVDVAGRISNDDFHASVDLSRIVAEAGGTPVVVPVNLVAVNDRIEIIDWEPRRVTVRLDPVLQKPLAVVIERSGAPDGLAIGPTIVEPSVVMVSGPSSRVLGIRRIEGRVTIDASALNIDQDVEVQAVDDRGQVVPQVQLQPDRVHVNINIAKDLASKPVSVLPQVVGDPVAGYRLAGVTVRPLVVTISGERLAVSQIQTVNTMPIDVSTQTVSFDVHIALELPPEVSVAGSSEVDVSIQIMPEDGSRTYPAGLTLLNARSDLLYGLSVSQVLVTIGGPVALLDTIDTQELAGTVDVQGLGTGEYDLPVRIRAPDGTRLVTIVPPRITVTVTEPPPTPSPVPTGSTAGPTESPSPGANPSPQGGGGRMAV